MDFALTDIQRQLQSMVTAFMEKECPPAVIRGYDEADRYPTEIYEKMAAAGWFGLPLPVAWGGAEGTAMDLALMFETIAKHWVALAAIYHTAAVFPLSILHSGTSEQHERYLRDMAEGKARFAFGLTEPGAGSDAGAVKTTAVRHGDEFVLNGAKVFTSGADVADWIILVVRTNVAMRGSSGLSVVLVDARAPGIRIRAIPKLGIKGLSTCEVFLDDVRVPVANLLGSADQGWKVVMQTLELERLSVAARCTGGCQAVLEDAVRYANERKQFGQHIGKFQAIQHIIADMEIAVQASRLLTYRLAWMIDKGLPCALEASVAKVYTAEAYNRVATMGVQVLGGYGYTMEYAMQRHFRDAKLYEIGGGTSQIQRGLIAKAIGL